MKFNSKAFKKSIEYDLSKNYEKLPFLKEYLFLDKINTTEGETIESYLIINRKSRIERVLEVYTSQDFEEKNSAYVGTIYKTESYYYLIRSKLIK